MTIRTQIRPVHNALVRHSFYPLLACTGMAMAFLAARFYLSETQRYRFLAWNLFLAWVPYGCALATLYVRRTRPDDRWQTAALATVWLLALPNAPYILTDLVHLTRGAPPLAWWFDLGLVLSFALAGCFLGVASLRAMHDLVRRATGEVVGWVFVLAVSALSGFGIYLGRFLRFNSWDVIADPLRLAGYVADRVLDPAGNPRAVGVTLMFGALMFACYVMYVSAGGWKRTAAATPAPRSNQPGPGLEPL
jgi:uncharacterized membrane protein